MVNLKKLSFEYLAILVIASLLMRFSYGSCEFESLIDSAKMQLLYALNLSKSMSIVAFVSKVLLHPNLLDTQR